MKKDVVLQPGFYDDFACIGGACRNDCCHGWLIDFTKEEFKNVKRKIHTDEFQEVFQDAFYFDKGKWRIKLDEKQNCKFLDENGLCKMYIEVGHENMSVTCKIFPRYVVKYLDNYERFLSVGCEKVVDLLLEQKDGLQLEVVEKEIPKLEKDRALLYSPIAVQQNLHLQLWTDMKILLLGVLQCKEYTFGERMVLLGLAAQKIQELFDKKQIEEIQKYIQDFVVEIEQNKQVYTKFFEKINKDGQKRALQTIYFHVDKISEVDLKEKVQKKIDLNKKVTIDNQKEIDEVTENENHKTLKANINIQYSSKKYQQAMKDFEEFLKEKEYWLENVMIEGFLYSKGFYRVKGGFWRNYCAMAITYSIFLFMLTCCLEKDSTKEEFQYYVTQIARTLFHNDEHTKNLEEQLQKTESDSLAHIAVLVL